jgi:hypothetical protein
VLAADRVVVGDGAAGGQHGLGRGAFTSVPAPQAWAGAPESRATTPAKRSPTADPM